MRGKEGREGRRREGEIGLRKRGEGEGREIGRNVDAWEGREGKGEGR